MAPKHSSLRGEVEVLRDLIIRMDDNPDWNQISRTDFQESLSL